jgi:S-layer homology domain
VFSHPFQLVSVPAPTAGLFRVPGANITLLAGLRLPAGALIARVEVDGCDIDAAGQIGLFLGSATSPAGSTPITLIAAVGTGTAAQPGCALFQSVFGGGITPADRTIDNAGRYYFLALNMNAPGLAFSNVRVYYQLQVSPAPGAATFSDVPTNHPFFQFVEALAASGITVGCGVGIFCPDAPLTRGQMAVFLSRGLGLHFAP